MTEPTEHWIARQIREAKEWCEKVPWMKSSVEKMKQAQERGQRADYHGHHHD